MFLFSGKMLVPDFLRLNPPSHIHHASKTSRANSVTIAWRGDREGEEEQREADYGNTAARSARQADSSKASEGKPMSIATRSGLQFSTCRIL